MKQRTISPHNHRSSVVMMTGTSNQSFTRVSHRISTLSNAMIYSVVIRDPELSIFKGSIEWE